MSLVYELCKMYELCKLYELCILCEFITSYAYESLKIN